MVYLIIYFALFAIWITVELLIAPKGFEDSEGFHFGDNKKARSVNRANTFTKIKGSFMQQFKVNISKGDKQ